VHFVGLYYMMNKVCFEKKKALLMSLKVQKYWLVSVLVVFIWPVLL